MSVPSAQVCTQFSLFVDSASYFIFSQKGFSPLHVAAKYGKMEVASLLLHKRAAPDAAGKVRTKSSVSLLAKIIFS